MSDRKLCTKCFQEKPHSEFWKSRNTKDGFNTKCKDCGREAKRRQKENNPEHYRKKRKEYYHKYEKTIKAKLRQSNYIKRWRIETLYGITHEEYLGILAKQNYACAICEGELIPGTNKKPHIDHCHETGKVRGVLCKGCNTALGFLGDNIEGVKRALAYLSESESLTTKVNANESDGT